MKDIFQRIHDNNLWGGSESSSGPGSSLHATAAIRAALPALIEKYSAQSILDVPCGDFNWMAEVLKSMPTVKYTGGDILPDLIKRNAKRWPGYTFVELDITSSELPQADLILVRDCLVHFSLVDTMPALGNIQKAGFKYLLMTNFSTEREYRYLETGQWQPVNFTLPPFSLPPPVYAINEGNSGHPDKELALWAL